MREYVNNSNGGEVRFPSRSNLNYKDKNESSKNRGYNLSEGVESEDKNKGRVLDYKLDFTLSHLRLDFIINPKPKAFK